MDVKIRAEQLADFEGVYELLEAAFGRVMEARLVNLLRESNTYVPQLALVAESSKKVMGYILLTRIRIEGESGVHQSLALAPVAVTPKMQKKGIGGLLIKEGIRLASLLGYPSIIVLGHDTYYPRFGFAPAERWGIKPPFDVPSNVFMALELTNNALSNAAGTVVYPKEFEMV